MHFGKQLHLLAYQPWKNDYIDFGMLKRVIKSIFDAARQQDRIMEVPRGWKDDNDAAAAAQQSERASPATSTHHSRASSPSRASQDGDDDHPTKSGSSRGLFHRSSNKDRNFTHADFDEVCCPCQFLCSITSAIATDERVWVWVCAVVRAAAGRGD